MISVSRRAPASSPSTCDGDDPLLMLTAPVPATRRVLVRAGLALDRIDHCEVNEAFASVPLMWQTRDSARRSSSSILAAVRLRSAIRSGRRAPA